jgi:hypothetical protein
LDEPLKKFKERVLKWASLGKGMQLGALTYNTFAMSTLLYVAQLMRVPDKAIELERSIVTKMFPGPGHWIEPEDLWFMHEAYGTCKSVQSLSIVAKAAKLRIATLGCHFDSKVIGPSQLRRLGQDNIFERAFLLKRTMAQSDHIDRIAFYHKWYQNNLCCNLVSNIEELKAQGINATDIINSIVKCPIRDIDDEGMQKLKSTFQSQVSKAIKSYEAPCPVQRIRYKLSRWQGTDWGISGLQRDNNVRAHRHICHLTKLVPPRIHAAVLHTLFNGWTTHRRMQKRKALTNLCVFKCNATAEDSIEHYCRCSVVQRIALRTLKIEYVPEQALNLWSLSSKGLDNDSHLISIAILQYGVYNAFNTLRNSPVNDSQQAYHCILQHCRQGVFGHPKCMKHFDSRWTESIQYI